MRTGRFRFVERRRLFRPPLQVLEVEISVPADQHCSFRERLWITASPSDAHEIQTTLAGSMTHASVLSGSAFA